MGPNTNEKVRTAQSLKSCLTEAPSMEESQVKLHGNWASAYVDSVIWALKLKGVKYDYIEEDLSNKSSSLLEYNPVHNKVPVLVHNGKPIAESAVIIQYIDETWPDRHYSLLPLDPYERAVARFWSAFVDQKVMTFFEFFLCSEEEKEKTAKQVLEILKFVEDEALGGKKFFGGDKIGFVDLRFGWLAHWFGTVQEVVGVQILEPNTLPRLYQWTTDFRQEAVVKEHHPDYESLLAFSKSVKERLTTPKHK